MAVVGSDEQRNKSFDFASEVTKQLITLATGVVTLTISFSGDVLSLAAGNGRGILTWGWIAFLVSILAGIATLMALTGQLGKATSPSVYGGPVRTFSIAQIFSFLVGVGFMIWYLGFALTQEIVVPKPG
jgi:hypothetical protein